MVGEGIGRGELEWKNFLEYSFELLRHMSAFTYSNDSYYIQIKKKNSIKIKEKKKQSNQI